MSEWMSDAQTDWRKPPVLMGLMVPLVSWEILRENRGSDALLLRIPAAPPELHNNQGFVTEVKDSRQEGEGPAAQGENVTTFLHHCLVPPWWRPLLGPRRPLCFSRRWLGWYLRKLLSRTVEESGAMPSGCNSQCRACEAAQDLREKKRLWVTMICFTSQRFPVFRVNV